jgi:hypothetical protein
MPVTLPAVDVAAEEIERWFDGLCLPPEHDQEPHSFRACASDVIAALWDAGYAITPTGRGAS